MTTLAQRVDAELRRHVVGTQIICPVTHEVLDVRTAVFALDSDGDPRFAFSPTAAAKLREVIDSGRYPFGIPNLTLEVKADKPVVVRSYAQQKAALTRAIKKGHLAVVDETRRAVTEWDSKQAPFTHGWPDDWSRWQRAMDDTARYPQQAPDINDL